MTSLWLLRETAAYALPALPAACVAGAGTAAAIALGGPVGVAAGLVAAAGAAQVLRHPVGAALGILVDGRQAAAVAQPSGDRSARA